MVIMAFESSCDETSVAIVKDGKILSNVVNSQIKIHEKFGGVIPEIASRNHIANFNKVIDKALLDANLKVAEIDFVAVTYGPGLIGALICGIVSANAFALANNIPIIPINHLEGHIFSSFIDSKPNFPAIILLISGGHTELIYAKNMYHFEKVGQSKDDAIGECYDKVARILGYPYPGGPIIDKIANSNTDYKNYYKLPRPLINEDSLNFSYSGLKSAVLNKVNELKQKNEKVENEKMASSFQNAALDILLNKTRKALVKYNTKNLIIGGGVSANKGLRSLLENDFKDYNILIPNLKYCTDNAAMIGICAYYKLLKIKNKKKLFNYFIKPFATKDELK